MDSKVEILIFNWLTIHLKFSVVEADGFIEFLKKGTIEEVVTILTEKADRYHSEECIDYLDCAKCAKLFNKL